MIVRKLAIGLKKINLNGHQTIVFITLSLKRIYFMLLSFGGKQNYEI